MFYSYENPNTLTSGILPESMDFATEYESWRDGAIWRDRIINLLSDTESQRVFPSRIELLRIECWLTSIGNGIC